ncbi:MAG: DUF1579 domain-containing protein [Ignavibacteria bacterium]|nr:DUF1579 domain-containing protein [Ignavibacteria bacterium]
MWQKIIFSFAVLIIVNFAYSQSEIEFFEDYFTLNTKNELLSQFVGNWKVNIAYFGGNQEENAQGQMDAKLIFYYRILEMNFKIQSSVGLPFEMKYLIGYDGISKKFFLIILNSLTNEVQILKGIYKDKTKEFIFNGTTVDTKQKKRVPLTMKFLFERDNKLIVEALSGEANKEKLISKSMLIRLNKEE